MHWSFCYQKLWHLPSFSVNLSPVDDSANWSQGIAKVVKIHPLGTVNICAFALHTLAIHPIVVSKVQSGTKCRTDRCALPRAVLLVWLNIDTLFYKPSVYSLWLLLLPWGAKQKLHHLQISVLLWCWLAKSLAKFTQCLQCSSILIVIIVGLSTDTVGIG